MYNNINVCLLFTGLTRHQGKYINACLTHSISLALSHLFCDILHVSVVSSF